MKAATVATLIAVGLAAAGCATKRYPMATPLGSAERSAMTCRELDLEMIRVDEVRAQINSTAKTDWRSVAGFLGDYGIGNAMAKGDADRALDRRTLAINAARAEKNCGPPPAIGGNP